jgi:hypothetical protein
LLIWRFANVVERQGKIVRDHVLISGSDQHHPEGTYYLEWYEVGNRRRRKAVRDFAELIDQARRKAIELDAMRAGSSALPQATGSSQRPAARRGGTSDFWLVRRARKDEAAVIRDVRSAVRSQYVGGLALSP